MVDSNGFSAEGSAMGLNFKSDRVYQLAKQLAHETGHTMTSANEQALEEKLIRLHRHRESEARYRRIKDIVSRLPPVPSGVTSDHSYLYDERGLPA